MVPSISTSLKVTLLPKPILRSSGHETANPSCQLLPVMNLVVPGGTVTEPQPTQSSVGSAWTPVPGAAGLPRGCCPDAYAGQEPRPM